MSQIVMKEQEKTINYFALYLAIIKRISVSQALLQMGITLPIKSGAGQKKSDKNYNLKDETIKEAIRLKEKGYTWKKIADKNNATADTMYRRVKRYMGDNWENRSWK